MQVYFLEPPLSILEDTGGVFSFFLVGSPFLFPGNFGSDLGCSLSLEGPKSNQSIIETKLLCLVVSTYVVGVNYCVQSSEAYEASVAV